jgi:integral membrane sensor domain MASE1
MMWGTILAGHLARPWARWAAGVALAALTVALFIINLRRAGERAGRSAARLQHLERHHVIQRQMLEAAAGRPRNRDDLLKRLRNGGF